ncbi:hypothetical protein SUGI_0436690 [Cryptomeria japonica]|nr:hypothetical protein SUGI_0436690 [Cryptomeria japonica]
MRDDTLVSQEWQINKKIVFFQKWVPGFNPRATKPYNAPLWLRLYNLPNEFWTEDVLSRIGNSLGHMVDLNMGKCDSILYARVHILAIKWIPAKINLSTSFDPWLQDLEIE